MSALLNRKPVLWFLSGLRGGWATLGFQMLRGWLGSWLARKAG